MDNAEAGVKADGQAGDTGFGFEEGVEVVEECVRGIDCQPWSCCERRSSLSEAKPVFGNELGIPSGEVSCDVCPCCPVGDCSVSFGEDEAFERLSRV